MKKYWLLFLLLLSLGSRADTFFVTNRYRLDPIPSNWIDTCPNKVCTQKNWFQAPEIDHSYQFGYIGKRYPKVQNLSTSIVRSDPSNVESPMFINRLRNQLRTTNGRIVIFIHGYNVDFNEGMSSLEKIDQKLLMSPQNATTMLFDWKSEGTLIGYIADEEHSRVGALGFSYLIRALAQEEEAKEIHIIAHSMGNRVAVDGLERATWMLEQAPSAQKSKLKSIVYFASDLNPQEHGAKLPRIHQIFADLSGTVFYSKSDIALLVSSLFHSSKKRAGSQDSGTTLCVTGENGKTIFTKNINAVDVSVLPKSWRDPIGHSYILESRRVVEHLKSLIFKTSFSFKDNYLVGTEQFGDDFLRILGCPPARWVLVK